jgi:fibronectin type 3 domain-containing protein
MFSNRKIKKAHLIAVALISGLAGTCAVIISMASPAPILENGFESGNLQGWNTAGVGDVSPTVVGDIVRSGSKSAKFTLTSSQNRSELILGGNGGGSTSGTVEFREGEEYYYGFSIYVSSMVYGKPGGHNLIMQLKGDDSGSPAFGLQLWDYAGNGGTGGGKGLWSHGSTGDRFLSPLSEQQWNDIVVRFKVSKQNSGSFQIYLNGNLIDSKNNINTLPSAASYAYIKNGLYRNGGSLPGTSDIRLDNVKLGDTLESITGDTTAPTVSLTAPANSATVSGTVAISANASDNVGAAGVQFKVNGNNEGSEDTSSPYSSNWDTTTVSNGTYTITAVARDVAGNTTTSGSRTVTVSNTSSSAAACNKVASPNGSDSAVGTEAAPYKTVKKLTDSLSVGQTGCLRNGTYGGSDFNINTSGITLTSYPNERATVNSFIEVTASATGSTIKNIKFDRTGGNETGLKIQADNAKFIDNELTNNNRGICMLVGRSGTKPSNILIERNYIHSCGPTDTGPDNKFIHQIYLSYAQNAIVRNNILADNLAGWGVHLYPDADGTIIEKNIIDGNRGGVVFAGYGDGTKSDNNIVRNNAITFSGPRNSAEGSWSGGPLGTGNTVSDNCLYSTGPGAPSGLASNSGFTASNNTTLGGSPYVNRAGKDYHFVNGSPCALLVGDVASSVKWLGGTTPAPTPDTTNPTVSITSPSNNATVSGVVSVSANASDNVGVAKVEFSVDGSLKLTDNSSPYSYSLDTKTLNNGNHTVSAKAFDAAGNSATNTITINVQNLDTTSPNAPSGLSASAANSTTVNLAWSSASDTGANQTGVVKYNVLRNGVVIAQPTSTSYIDNGRSANTQYTYAIQAVDGAGNVSANSNTATVTTPSAPDTTPPSIPSNVQGNAVNATQINLTWSTATDTGGSGLAGYNVYRSGSKVNSNLITATSYSDSTVSGGATYGYRVEAVDGAGNKSAQSSVLNITTPDIGAPTISISAPANNATVSGTITISASASDDVGVSRVEFSVNGSTKLTDNSSPYNYSLDTKTLTNGTHTISAKAFDAAGNSSVATITINVNNPDVTPPNAPIGLAATPTNPTTINLSWSPASDTGSNQTGVSKYNVLRNGVVIAQTVATTYTDSNRTSDTMYIYAVQAVDGASNTSANSSSVTVKTPAAPDATAPATPGNFKVVSTSTSQVILSWNISTDTGGSGLAGYNIYRNGAKLNNSLVSATSYGDSTVASSSTYSYQVEAVDGAGNKSSKASLNNVTTPGVKRGDITGPNGVSDGAIDLRDISYVIRKYGTNDPGADITGPNGVPDGVVDLRDASYVIRNYGK